MLVSRGDYVVDLAGSHDSSHSSVNYSRR